VTDDEMLAYLCRVWAEVLEVEPADIGPDSDFFDVGGQSVTAVRLIERLRADLDLAVPLRTLFDHPTVAELSEGLRSLAAA
jgi:nonribosomal peptide synthetase DhbF